MSKPTALRSVSSFADLPELYAEAIATPDFVASFGDPLPLTIIEPDEEPAEHFMPDPLAAQAECGGIIAAIFDLLGDTRLDPLAPELAWGFVNSFHFVANKLEGREDRLADTIRDMARRLEPGEVFNKELEDTQLECQSVAEQRAAMEAMRDYAAAMYRAYAGRPWSPAKGSRASHVTTASQISALDFLRARSERKRDRYDPQGPVVVVSGPSDWHDGGLSGDGSTRSERAFLTWCLSPPGSALGWMQPPQHGPHSGAWSASRSASMGAATAKPSGAIATLPSLCPSRRCYAKGRASSPASMTCSTRRRATASRPMFSCGQIRRPMSRSKRSAAS